MAPSALPYTFLPLLVAAPRPARNAVRAALGVMVAAWVVYAFYAGMELVSNPSLKSVIGDWVFNGLLLSTALACLARGALVAEDRAPWLLLGSGMAMWALGMAYWTISIRPLEEPPYPSMADALYLSFYPPAYVALAVLARRRLKDAYHTALLDGLTAGLGVIALGAAIVLPAMLAASEGTAAAIATNLAYPVADLLLIALVAAMCSASGWRPGTAWSLIGAGLVTFAVADSVYLHRVATETFTEGTFLDALWPAGMVLLALAAWHSARDAVPATVGGWWALTVPSLFGLVALALLLYGNFESLNPIALAAAAATLVAALARAVDTITRRDRYTSRVVATRLRERDEANAARRESEADSARFFAVSQDMLMTITPDGRLVSANGSWQRVLGWDRDELVNNRVSDLLHPDDRDESLREHSRLMSERTPTLDFENRYRASDGSYRWLLWSAQVEADGKVYGAAKDITDRKGMERDLARSRDEALEASRLKSQFLANMSHEVRTPMNGVMGMVELLLNTSLTPEQRLFAETARSSSEALLAILEDILDISKIEAGKLTLDRTDVEVGELLAAVSALLTTRAAEKGLELDISAAGEVPSRVRADEGRLRQILVNLVSNAIKFTEQGQVAVAVTVVEAGGAVALRFDVSDTGVGIEPEMVDPLFEPFVQGDGSSTRSHGGTGLGLAISRQLAEMMGGAIGAVSEPGRGSTFWFTVPLDPSPTELPTPSAVG